MNRQQRRMQERKEKKKNRISEQKFELNMSMIQPWSTFVMKTKLPDAILGKMLEITDEMVDNAENEKSWGKNLAGQIEHELYVDCLLYTSPSPRDLSTSRMPSSA